jgi:tRNA (guanine-N7-)-methyltransferase
MPRNNPYNDVPCADSELDLVDLGQGRRVELEIGFGRGHFSMGRALARPDVLILGLEVRRKWVATVIDRADRAGLDNVWPRFGDARHLLPTWGPAGSLSAVYVNFPDPWWKKRHQKRLVLAPSTIEQVVRLLAPGGALLVQTDVAERAEAYRTMLEAEPGLFEAHPEGERFLEKNPIGVASHREKKCLEAGLPVYRLLFKKRQALAEP